MLFPKVKSLKQNGVFAVDPCEIPELCGISGLSFETVMTVFGAFPEKSNTVLLCKRDEALLSLSDEAYSLKISEENGFVTVIAAAPSDKALTRALFTLKRMIMSGEVILGEITDYPSFPVRGYIEGFYGKPWKSEQRLNMLETMALFGENTHYYAPKDDPYHRALWRECYPEREALGLKALIEKAESLYVDLYYCIAPGLSMCYSDENDIEALFNKTRQLYSMGIRCFGLLLDDIPYELYFEEDRLRFGNTCRAHAQLVCRYYEFLQSLSPDTRLTVCPTSYHGKGTEAQLTDFAKNIPAPVSIFFTGPDICSKELTCRDAEIFLKNTGHRPLYWDNYPVNDAEMFMEMHIGPIIGREEELYRHSEGIISNCMEYFECNKLSLITIAAYLWNPVDYEPEAAFSAAVDYMIETRDREAFIHLSDQFRTSCLHDENSRIMGARLSEALMCFNTGQPEAGIKKLTAYAEEISRCALLLKKKDEPLYKELARWIRKFILMSDILTMSVEVLKGNILKAELEKLMEEYNESATVLTAFCFREYIEWVLDNEN